MTPKKLTYFYDLLNLDVPRNDVLDPLSLLPSMTWNLCYQPIEASKVLVMPKVCSPISKSCGRFGQFSPHACRYKVRPSSKKWKKIDVKKMDLWISSRTTSIKDSLVSSIDRGFQVTHP